MLDQVEATDAALELIEEIKKIMVMSFFINQVDVVMAQRLCASKKVIF